MNAETPQNTLDETLRDIRSGAISREEMARRLLQARLAVPSQTDVQPDGSGLIPLAFDYNGQGVIAVFADVAYCSAMGKLAPSRTVVDARAFLKMVPPDLGLMINPGRPEALAISADGLQEMLREFGDA